MTEVREKYEVFFENEIDGLTRYWVSKEFIKLFLWQEPAIPYSLGTKVKNKHYKIRKITSDEIDELWKAPDVRN